MINGKEIILGNGDLRISSMRLNYKGSVAIKLQSKHEVWGRVENPITAEECFEEADTVITIDKLSGAEVLVSKILEAMLYHQGADDKAELVKKYELIKNGKSDFKSILESFIDNYDFTLEQ